MDVCWRDLLVNLTMYFFKSLFFRLSQKINVYNSEDSTVCRALHNKSSNGYFVSFRVHKTMATLWFQLVLMCVCICI